MNYKRSVRLKFSPGFIKKKMMVYRSNFRQAFAVTFTGGPNEVSSYLSRRYHRKTGIDCRLVGQQGGERLIKLNFKKPKNFSNLRWSLLWE